MPISKEDVELVKYFDWVKHEELDDIIWHCENERRCSPQQGALRKRKGVKAGVADIWVSRAANGCYGLYIELKSENGRLSPLQAKFLRDMDAEGYAVDIAYSAEEAILKTKLYLGLIMLM